MYSPLDLTPFLGLSHGFLPEKRQKRRTAAEGSCRKKKGKKWDTQFTTQRKEAPVPAA